MQKSKVVHPLKPPKEQEECVEALQIIDLIYLNNCYLSFY